jgi:flagellar biosynthesis protein FlhA
MARASTFNLLTRVFPFLRVLMEAKQLTIVLVIVGIMAIIIVPLPSAVLDLFLVLSISIATLIILISVFIARPTDFTTYPTLVLLVTLFRLSLNVATTRMILSEGHNGPDSVSDIIASFGSFVVGGNYVIGIVIFSILVLVNFLVITNGSTRVAEVSARFTLDAMPGKQMAIDADLNAGLIDEEQARQRRQEIISEANFYGAMDGSSKFVKGDAIAAIIITLINIIGGILIGVFQHDMSMGESATTFTVLTIGDGLVGTIPALLVATATGIIITRASKEDANFASGVITQLGRDYKVMFIVGGILLLFAAVPGLPTISLLVVGLCFLIMALLVRDSQDGAISNFLKARFPILAELSAHQAAADAATAQKNGQKSPGKPTAGSGTKPGAKEGEPKPKEKSPEELKAEEEKALEDILKVELLELDVGYQLIKLADKAQGGDLLDRIRTMRRKIASEFGFLMPQVRIRDNLQLEPNSYEILLKGVSIGGGQVYPGHFLAMNSGLVMDEIEGIATKEPAFGLDATWVTPDRKEDAIIKGYTVVDPATVITTHLSELVKKHAEEMLTRQDVQKLVDSLKKEYPAVAEDALRAASVGVIQRILKDLLHEKVPIRDMLTIMETIADVAEVTKSPDILLEQVRSRLARTITGLYKNDQGMIRLLTIDTANEQQMLDKVKEQNGQRNFLLSVKEIGSLVEATGAKAKEVLERGVAPVVIIVDPMLRKPLSDIYERFGLDVVVLSHAEIDPSARFEVLGSIVINDW